MDYIVLSAFAKDYNIGHSWILWSFFRT